MRVLRTVLVVWLGMVAQVAGAPASVQITEFCAAGRQGVRDADGETPDWIELHNLSPAPINLEGWSVSEESRRLRSWTFPSTNLSAGGYLLVFASGKDRRIAGEELHTSFKLPDRDGVLVLRGPGGEESRIDRYPSQIAGVSFGVIGSNSMPEGNLVPADCELRYLVPVNDLTGPDWIKGQFDDSRWRRGRGGVGYDSSGTDYSDLLRTDVGRNMLGRATSLYLRIPFVSTNSAGVSVLTLHAQYDDGFVAWLNGREIARRNAPENPDWNSVADAVRPDAKAREVDVIQVPGTEALLVPGTNWLAVQVLNVGPQSSDLLFRATLNGTSRPSAAEPVPVQGPVTYLEKSTPGLPNAPAVSSGPRIEWLRAEPIATSQSDQPLVITARVHPLSAPVTEVRLMYRVMFGRETELRMADDGLHGDGAPGDSIYGASIPRQSIKPGQMLRYCALANDSTGGASRWPLFSDRPGYSRYEGIVLPDPSVQTRLPVLHLFMSNAARRDGTAIYYDGELYDNVSIDEHGQISRGFPKSSYNIRFPHDHLLRYRPDQSRVEAIKLLANYADKSKIRNSLAYDFIALSGSHGHFAFPVRVQRNGRFFSVAEIVENGDSRWLERLGLDSQGALYKMYDNLTSPRGGEKKTRKHEDMRDLSEFVRALSEGRPLEQRAAYAYANIDLPQCISYFVAMTLISSDDHGHKNYYVYRDSRHSGEWSILPWDIDLSLGRNWTGQYFNETVFSDNPLNLYRNGRSKPHNPLYNLFFSHPEFRQMYLRRLRTVMDTLLQSPDTPREALILEKRVAELIDRVDPPGINPSDAELDEAAWESWGKSASAREEAQRIITQHLPGRRQFLFKSARAKLHGDPIPPAQPSDAAPRFQSAGGAGDSQFVCLTNPHEFALDISGWKVKGGGIEHTFRPGTVIPMGKAIYLVGNVAGFRKAPPADAGAPPFFVQGNWKGKLQPGSPIEILPPTTRARR